MRTLGATRYDLRPEALLRLQLAAWSARAFLFAAACVAVATLVRLGLDFFGASLVPFPTYFPAVLIAAVVGGAAAGIFATLLGGVCAMWFVLGPEAGGAANFVLYCVTALLIVWCAEQFRRLCERFREEAEQRNRHIALLNDQNEVLAEIAAGASLQTVFEKLLRSIERYSGFEMLGSIQLLDSDGTRLRHGAAPSLPESYSQAIDGAMIGPTAGSCGTAAYRKERVVVADIATDPLWADWRAIALKHGLKACWSIPIMSNSSTVLGTFAIYYREPRWPAGADLNVISFLSRTAMIGIEHDRKTAQQRLLANELEHRVKNTLTIVQSIASQTLRRRIDAGAWSDFEARLVKLSRTYDLLVQANWSAIDLQDLVVQTVLDPFVAERGRIQINGEPVRLPPRLALVFSMVLHELCTNAAKYGSLSISTGTVSITWQVARAEAGAEHVGLQWAERGGPSVAPPNQKGFGSRLIETALGGEFGGSAKLDYRPDGLMCSISAKLTDEGSHASPGGRGNDVSPTDAGNVTQRPADIDRRAQSWAGDVLHAGRPDGVGSLIPASPSAGQPSR